MALTAISPLDGRYAAQVQSLAPFFPPQQRAACPARVPPRAAGLQAALAGAARRVPRPRPGGGGAGGRGGGGRRGGAKRACRVGREVSHPGPSPEPDKEIATIRLC